MNLDEAQTVTERRLFATSIAKDAGSLALSYSFKRHALNVKYPTKNDLVTEADYQVETFIRERIHTAYPEDGILGEEHGFEPPNKNESGIWVVDAIDGSVNFLHGIPYWSVSIAYYRNGVVQVGVVYSPATNELFSAQVDTGVWLNGTRVNVSITNTPEKAIIGVGHAFRRECNYFSQLKTLTKLSADYRRFGSCALSMAYVACGRLDGYYEAYLPAWDFLAGWLLVKEAGGQVFELPLDVIQRGAEIRVLNGKLNRFALFPSTF
ncbi:inositol monophosphatase [Vibrio kyushuensis]|uniref:inositol monophosphatase family protein n=1 Tax=Vibrio kyushuensis TaxID=2910249 RepID=UPI003D12608B